MGLSVITFRRKPPTAKHVMCTCSLYCVSAVNGVYSIQAVTQQYMKEGNTKLYGYVVLILTHAFTTYPQWKGITVQVITYTIC